MASFPARILHIATAEDASRELAAIQVDPAGIAMMSAKMTGRCVKLSGLLCRQANILKQEMLSLGGDAAVARGTVACSIPSTDVILMGTDKQLRKLCSKLHAQPFQLPVLGNELTLLLDRVTSPPRIWKTSRRTFSLNRPLIMGILNVTPDSFSDGNRYLDPQQAIDHALNMIDHGADIIDIGGESTRPGAETVSELEELERVMPVITALVSRSDCALSLDSWKSAVARRAIDAGVEIINDISGLTFDADMASVVASAGSGTVLMHTRGTPRTMQSDTAYDDLIGDVLQSLQNSVSLATAAGLPEDCIAIDPGIGFAKTAGHNIEILRRLPEFSSLGRPIMVGTSRKSFIGRILGREPDQRVAGTTATVALAVASGASILRVHDVPTMRDVADMAHAISFPPGEVA